MATTPTPQIANPTYEGGQQAIKLHALDPHRKSVLIVTCPVATITLLVAATVLTFTGAYRPILIATLNSAATLTAVTTLHKPQRR